jgi:hypothetical protein
MIPTFSAMQLISATPASRASDERLAEDAGKVQKVSMLQKDDGN